MDHDLLGRQRVDQRQPTGGQLRCKPTWVIVAGPSVRLPRRARRRYPGNDSTRSVDIGKAFRAPAPRNRVVSIEPAVASILPRFFGQTVTISCGGSANRGKNASNTYRARPDAQDALRRTETPASTQEDVPASRAATETHQHATGPTAATCEGSNSPRARVTEAG